MMNVFTCGMFQTELSQSFVAAQVVDKMLPNSTHIFTKIKNRADEVKKRSKRVGNYIVVLDFFAV